MLKIFKENRNKNLRGIFVFLPMLDADERPAAADQARQDTDLRLTSLWDNNKAIAHAFAGRLGLTRTAWDVYLIYRPGIRWTSASPPAPTFWMHQLSSDPTAPPGKVLAADKFARQLSKFARE